MQLHLILSFQVWVAASWPCHRLRIWVMHPVVHAWMPCKSQHESISHPQITYCMQVVGFTLFAGVGATSSSFFTFVKRASAGEAVSPGEQNGEARLGARTGRSFDGMLCSALPEASRWIATINTCFHSRDADVAKMAGSKYSIAYDKLCPAYTFMS